MSADIALAGRRTCRWCGEEFFMSISREEKDRTVHIRTSVREATGPTKATLAEPCTVRRGHGEDWVLVMGGGKKYLYGRDGRVREAEAD